MQFNDYLMLASRNLMNQKSRSLLAILAIVIGTTSVTVMLALVMGAKGFYYNQFKATGKLEQVVVNSQTGLSFEQSQQSVSCESCVKLTDRLADEIKKYNHVENLSRTVAVNIFETATLDGQKQILSGTQGYEPNGVIKHIFVAGGDFSKKSGVGEVIISQNYADQWGYKDNYSDIIGKQISLTTLSSFTGQGAKLPDPLTQFRQCQNGCGADQIAQQKATKLKAFIVGVESDTSNSIFVPLKWAKGLLKNQRYEITKQDQSEYVDAHAAWVAGGQQGTEPVPKFTLTADDLIAKNGYSSFVVKADSPDTTATVAKQIRGLGVGAVTAKSYINDQLRVFNIISIILAGIGGISLVVAAIGVVNTMVMATLERTREIGVMRAIGARRSTVRWLFMFESSLLGFLGGIFGIIIGYSLIQLLNIFINAQLSAAVTPNENVIVLPAWLVLSIIIATTVIGMMAGLYPAHRAAIQNPVEALRHE